MGRPENEFQMSVNAFRYFMLYAILQQIMPDFSHCRSDRFLELPTKILIGEHECVFGV
jgi:hypothetical protein